MSCKCTERVPERSSGGSETTDWQLDIITTSWATSCSSSSSSSNNCKWVCNISANLTVEAKQQQHNEEEDRPDCRERHHGHGLGVGNESQAWTCRGSGGWMGGGWEQTQKGGGEGATLVLGKAHLICIPVARKGFRRWRRRARYLSLIRK